MSKGIDPCEVLGITDGPSFADALRAYGERWDQHAGRLLGAGEDLLVQVLRDDSEADPLALRQALTPRIRPVLESAAALEVLATQVALEAGDLPRPSGAATGTEPLEAEAGWPVPPPDHEVRERLRAWARGRRTVPDDRFDGRIEVHDASVARLVVTRMVQTVTETRMWTPAERPPLPEYSGDPAKAAGEHHGWGAGRWIGVRAGSIRPRSCSGCGGDGRIACQHCSGTMFQRCEPFEQCQVCSGTGRRYLRRTSLIRTVCEMCNGRGGVPCSFCGGMGRRPCASCTDGHARCQRCRGYGRVTEYMQAVVERIPRSEQHDIGEADRLAARNADGFTRLATLTRWRTIRGLPEPVEAAVRHALDAREPGQIHQKVELDVLQALRVDYWPAGTHATRRTVWLVGDEVRPSAGNWLRLPFNL
jgi:hypothetical protein